MVGQPGLSSRQFLMELEAPLTASECRVLCILGTEDDIRGDQIGDEAGLPLLQGCDSLASIGAFGAGAIYATSISSDSRSALAQRLIDSSKKGVVTGFVWVDLDQSTQDWEQWIVLTGVPKRFGQRLQGTDVGGLGNQNPFRMMDRLLVTTNLKEPLSPIRSKNYGGAVGVLVFSRSHSIT